MRKLSTEKRIQVVSALVEGCSIRATVRMTGVSKNTVAKLLLDLGDACRRFHDEAVRGLMSERVQCDEIWCFVKAKDRNLTGAEMDQGFGSTWTWTALDADSKLMVCWHVGDRGEDCARHFMLDLASRIDNRIQLTTDGHAAYPAAVHEAFGRDLDNARLVKMYRNSRDTEARYSPATCCGARRETMIGLPNSADVCTSHVERANLTHRMQMRRFTRLTNGYSKSRTHLNAAVSIHMVHYNFCRKHQTLKTTPAVASDLADHAWSIEELVGLLDAQEQAAIASGSLKRGPYRKRSNA